MRSILRHRRGAWMAVAGATLIIYLTLPLVRIPLAFLRQHGILNGVVNSGFVVVMGSVLYYLLACRGERRVHFYVAFCVVCAIYGYLMISMRLPEERIHFLEYGLLSLLALNGVRIEMRQRQSSSTPEPGAGSGSAEKEWRWGAMAMVLTFYLGWLDELFQGGLGWLAKKGVLDPAFGRVYDLRDVYMNGIGGFLAIALACLHLVRRSSADGSR